MPGLNHSAAGESAFLLTGTHTISNYAVLCTATVINLRQIDVFQNQKWSMPKKQKNQVE